MRKQTPVMVLLAIILFIALLSACATKISDTQILTDDYALNAESGCIYGNFVLLSEDNGYAILLSIKNVDTGEDFVFRLASEQEKILQVISVVPGNYRVESIYYVNDKNQVQAVLDFSLPPEQYTRDFVVEAYSAVYVGDYSGVIDVQSGEAYFSLKVPENYYAETTEKFKEVYPRLASSVIDFSSNM